ncbi:hypothetical protein LOK49_LG08G00859 [Camellia lanceoleosa]|uniref:Uncharacterized protein n=1 Tax=Camellia lanceoleosa TaxID=1840588 RepID=A0ACC0GR08_9ERIC|nr:hypothetical protein LOK49_LG08G00859 [Camellia lanceoleosa]
MHPLIESLSRRKIDRSTSSHTSQSLTLWFCIYTDRPTLLSHRSTNSLFAPIDLTSQRKVMDEKIRFKEEMDVKVGPPKRDEWMTTLPPERKPGVPTQSTKFSRTSKDGRGDTSIWTDNPSERAQKAKMNYLEADNEAAALASTDQENKNTNSDAALVDEYNKRKRPKSLVEKHKEAARTSSSSKKKSKQERAKEEWEGQHPWKPWDREKDLTAGRQSVKLYAKDMSQGLASRFSSGTFQRNFL